MLLKISILSRLFTDETVSQHSTRSILRRGDQGSDVRRLQTSLQALQQYQGAITGNFDQTTEQAVRRFHHRIGLPAHGEVTFRTWRAITRLHHMLGEPETH